MGLFNHYKMESNVIKIPIFLCPDKNIEKQILSCIKDNNAHMVIEQPCVDLHNLSLYHYIKKPIEYNEIMTDESNPLPANGFNVFPEYYTKLSSKLKMNWDFRVHINRFSTAISKINLEIDKIETLKNGLAIKQKLLGKMKNS